MKRFLKTMKWKMMIFGILTVIIGVAITIYPNAAAKAICYIIAGVLAVAGAISCIMYALSKEKDAAMTSTLILGVVELATGIIIFLNAKSFIDFIGIVFAGILIVHAINDIVQIINIKKMGYNTGKIPVISALLGIVLACVVFMRPFEAFSVFMVFAGISLILDGVSEIIIAFKVGACEKNYIDVENIVEADDYSVETEDNNETDDYSTEEEN